LLSLLGMPPLGGFWAKVLLATAMFDTESSVAFLLVIVLFTNTVISLYFYVRPVYYMVFVAEDGTSPAFSPRSAGVALVTFCALILLWTGVLPRGASTLARDYGTISVIQVQPPQPAAGHPAEVEGADHGGS
jgi:NADH-quinone oxidoreductase subunit N